MNFLEHSIRYAVTTGVAVLLLALFGGIALFNLPIQLTPTVEQPIITVTTAWPGSGPQEVETQIVQEQEEFLKSLEGLERMDSVSSQNQGTITLTFRVGYNLQQGMLNVANRLEQVRRYPDDALKPVIRPGSADSQPIARFFLRPGGPKPYAGEILTLYDYLEDTIRPEFERVEGVSEATVFGGTPHEMHFVADPAALASHGITISQLAAALDRENSNATGGDFAEGKNRYVVRTVAEYRSPEDIENVVVGTRGGRPVFAREVGRAKIGYRKPQAMASLYAKAGIGMQVVKVPETNVLEVMTRVKEAVKRLNKDVLGPRGLELTQTTDDTQYIDGAIALVKESLYYGAFLAAAVLWLFLRNMRTTLIISAAIPISIIGTFLVMQWFGRTLNVISLAGLAFAVGMVVDNCIVTLENIYRHRQMGKGAFEAALDGVQEVWGAVLASTLTTVAVFVPVLFVAEEAGQLFRDIAIAISAAVTLSLFVSVTVIPALCARHLVIEPPSEKRPNFLVRFFDGIPAACGRTVEWLCAGALRKITIVLFFTVVSVGLSWKLAPKVEYLPTGNSNFILGGLVFPPGYPIAETAKLAGEFEKAMGHLWNAPPEKAKDLPGGGIVNPVYVGFDGRAFAVASAADPMRVRELIPEFQKATRSIPGVIAAFRQGSIFQRGPAGADIELNIVGPDPDKLRALGTEALRLVTANVPGVQAAPASSIDAGVPELRIIPDRRRMAEVGISSRELGFAVGALVDGIKAADYRWEGKRIDLKIVANEGRELRTHLMEHLPIATATGKITTVGSVADIVWTTGPIQVSHRERQRVVTIRVTPGPGVALESVMDSLREKVIQPLQNNKEMSTAYRVVLSGSADKLTQTWKALGSNFLLAVVITYLLLCALFQSFTYPFVILFTVPLATLGGVGGLAVMNLYSFQALDVLTMLGFFILVGTVVNNAILIVHQSLNLINDHAYAPRAAIREATETRIRPIAMSVLTSVAGMFPLVLFPGPGSELYRGVGSVVIGGLLVSTLFTVLVVPSLFSLVMDVRSLFVGRKPKKKADVAEEQTLTHQ